MDRLTDNRRNIILIVGILFAFLYYPLLGHFVFYGQSHTLRIAFYSRLFIWLEVALLFCYARWVEKSSFLLWAEKSNGFWFYPASFAALYLLSIGAGIVSKIPLAFGLHDNQQVVREMAVIVTKNMPMMVFFCLTAGFTEELIFRGYLVPRLEALFKNKSASVVVSSLMFSLVHYHYFSISETIFTFCIGVVFAIYYQWYRNIKVLIFTHAFIDFVSFLIFGYAQAHHLIK